MPVMPGKRVLSVGQCAADHGGISWALQRSFGAQTSAADTVEEALAELRQQSFDLVLVNRIFDSDGSSGLEFIRRVKSDPTLSQVPIMLVSNYEESQAQAVAAGAVPGFGKASLGRPQMLERVGAFLAQQQA